jgi:type IV pilus assembly protein PilK
MSGGEGHGMQSDGTWALRPLAEMSVQEFRDWQVLLENRTGLVLSDQRRALLQASLSTRMRELNIADYSSYYQQVTDGLRGAIEWSNLLDHLTVQETRFFRHRPSFEILDGYLRRRISETGLRHPLALWSVGCSTGEESYSLAIVAAEALRNCEQPELFGVTGTDISMKALSKARNAEYGTRRLEQIEVDLLERYFDPLGEGRYKVRAALASRVCFARLNVLELAKAPFSGVDVIFCQNLLIYFRRWRRREILNRLVERLAPGGLLVIGVGEVVDWQHPDMLPVADDQVLAFIRKNV